MVDWDEDGTVNKTRDRKTTRADNGTSPIGSGPFGERVYNGFENSQQEYFRDIDI